MGFGDFSGVVVVIVLILFGTKVKNGRFFCYFVTFYEGLSTYQQSASCSVLQAPRATFQESYIASIRQRPKACPRGSSRHSSVPSPPSAAAVWRGRTAEPVQTTLEHNSTHRMVHRIFATFSTGRGTRALSQQSRGSPTMVEVACPEPYVVHSCTAASVAHSFVPGHVCGEKQVCLQLSLLSCGGGSGSQLATRLHSGSGGGV